MTLSLGRCCTFTVSSVHQTLQREIEGHQPRVDEVLERGRRMAAAAGAEGRPEAERIADQLKELEEAWARLQDEMAKRRERLNGSNLAQQYYNDADEAEAWIGEQELYMIADEKAKVRGGASAAGDRRGMLGRRCLKHRSYASKHNKAHHVANKVALHALT